jgi:hypothetical protein
MDNELISLIKELSNSNLPEIDLSEFKKYDLNIYNEYLYLQCGKEHYQLLANISQKTNNKKFYDIGTNYGASALALSFNKTNEVKSYDLINLLPCEILETNISFKIGDCIKDADLLNADLIFLDTAHDGSFEEIFLDFLVENSYRGIVIMDDVNEYPILRFLADKISQANDFEIIDLTRIGHYSGTLALIFK